MPSGLEKVVNRNLSGAEVKKLILADFERLLANEGLLSDHISYGRLAWRIRLKLHMDNYMNPESESFVDSRGSEPVEEFPLLNTEHDLKASVEISHNVTSANVERIRAGMPIPAEVRQHDGSIHMEEITYPKDLVDANGDTEMTDVTEEEKSNWEK